MRARPNSCKLGSELTLACDILAFLKDESNIRVLPIQDFIQSDLTVFNGALKCLAPALVPQGEMGPSDLYIRHFEKFCIQYKIPHVSVNLNLKNQQYQIHYILKMKSLIILLFL